MKFRIILTTLLVVVVGSIATLTTFSVMNMDHSTPMKCPLGMVMNAGGDCKTTSPAIMATHHVSAIDSAFEMTKQQGDTASLLSLFVLAVLGVVGISACSSKLHSTTAFEYIQWFARVRGKLFATFHRWHCIHHKRDPRASIWTYDVSRVVHVS